MEEAYEITRENAHKAAVRSKRHYDSKEKSSVLEAGDGVLIRNMTYCGGPGKPLGGYCPHNCASSE